MRIVPKSELNAKIKVIGVGGSGGNIINTLINDYDIPVDYIVLNTDAQALEGSLSPVRIQIGEQITRGLGSGGNPSIGKKAADESMDAIHSSIAGIDMAFIVAGMGGGTGTGAAPIVAGICKNLGALTIGVVTTPFKMESKKRMQLAQEGLDQLAQKVDALIVIPNERLMEVSDDDITFKDALKKADDVVAQAVASISRIVLNPGLINVDFADIRTVMSDAGTAVMGSGFSNSTTAGRAVEATKQAIENPLLGIPIDGAHGVLFNIEGAQGDLKLKEINDAVELVREKVHEDAVVIFGTRFDDTMEGVRVTVIATGFSSDYKALDVLNASIPKQTQVRQTSMQVTNTSNVQLDKGSDYKDDDMDSIPAIMRNKK